MSDDEADVLRLRLLMSRSELGAAYAWMKEAHPILLMQIVALDRAQQHTLADKVRALADRCPLPPDAEPDR